MLTIDLEAAQKMHFVMSQGALPDDLSQLGVGFTRGLTTHQFVHGAAPTSVSKRNLEVRGTMSAGASWRRQGEPSLPPPRRLESCFYQLESQSTNKSRLRCDV